MSKLALAHGAVAAGHPATVNAAAEVLRDGGNAVDAALAAACTAFIAEPVLTGPGGGGFMLLCPDGRAPMLFEGFARMPGGRPRNAELLAAPIDFGDTTQVFHIGQASVGTPSLMAMLFAAHQRLGRMPLATALQPALAAAREGIELNRLQASFLKLLTPILSHTEESRRLYAPHGKTLSEGTRFRNPDWANVLEMLALDGIDEMYRGELARAIVACCQPDGLLRLQDLEKRQWTLHPPLAQPTQGGQWLTNPPPAMGGLLVALGLRLLEMQPELERGNWHLHIAKALQALGVARSRWLDDAIRRPGVIEQTLNDAFVARLMAEEGLREPRNRHGSTTHISILDADGMAVSLTTSNGEGSGIVVPGTGIHLNNMLGEEDINPGGFHRLPPGTVLPSMMAPSIFLERRRPVLILGSGGSNRLRSAVLQTALRHLKLGESIESAIAAPRMHNEGHELDVEPGLLDAQGIAELAAQGWRIREWEQPSVYFGGVHAIAVDERGNVHAAGDPRRGGSAWVQ